MKILVPALSLFAVLLLSSCQTRREVEQVEGPVPLLTPTQYKLIYRPDAFHEDATGTFTDRPQIGNAQAQRLLDDSMVAMP